MPSTFKQSPETTTTLGGKINGATAKATPIDADIVGFVDTEASNVIKKLTWTNIKAFLKTYFDTLYLGASAVISSLVLTEAPGADHTGTGITVVMTAGENLAQSDAVYFKSDGKVYKVDADAVATMPGMGLATAAITSGQTGTILLQGIFRDDTWAWTVGGLVYFSGTAGGLTQTQPSGVDGVVQVAGLATHADRMYFNPVLTYVTHV